MCAAVAPAAPTAESRRLLRAVFGSTFFIRYGFGLTVSIFAAYFAGRTLGLAADTVGTLGIVSSLAPIGEFTTVLLSGTAADRFGRFPVLLSGIAASCVLLLALSFSRLTAILGGANFLFGVASGAILAASLAVVGDQSGRDERGYEMGRFDAVNLLGYVLGFATGFALLGLLPNGELPWVFRGGAALLLAGFLFAFLSVRTYREPTNRNTFRWSHLREAVVRRDVLLVTAPWIVIYMLLGTAFVFLGSAATGVGLPTPRLALLIAAGGLVLLLTQPYYGRLADRFGRMRLMFVGTAGFVVLLVFGGLVAQYGPRPELLVGIGAGALAALTYGPAALAALADVSRSVTRGTTMALYSLAISLGMILGLLGSATLYRYYGIRGLDLFFGGVAAGLVLLTLARWLEARRRSVVSVREEAGPAGRYTAETTIPVRPANGESAGRPPAA